MAAGAARHGLPVGTPGAAGGAAAADAQLAHAGRALPGVVRRAVGGRHRRQQARRAAGLAVLDRARAGLEPIAGLDAAAVQDHCLALATAYAAELPRLGLRPVASRLSQIVVAQTAKAAEYVAPLGRRGIVAAANGDRLRVGFHAFNTEQDVAAALAALRPNANPGHLH